MITLLLTLTKEFVEVPNQGDFKEGDLVIVSDEGTFEMAQVLSVDSRETAEIKSDRRLEIVRLATENDQQKNSSVRERGRELLPQAQEIVDKHKLPMHLWDASFSFDDKRITFFFAAEERIDFRELVRDLASTLGKKVHLQQVGPRDRAKIFGGFGVCGKKICCANFLKNLPSVSMEMARIQGLSYKSPDKISGQCGRLLCCLQYELETYRELGRDYPSLGEQVKIAEGTKKGRVVGNDVIGGKVKVLVSDDGHEYLVAVPLEEVSGRFRKANSRPDKEAK